MELMDRVRALATSGETREAIRLVDDAAAAGDPTALLVLANWRLYGLYGEQDWAQAHELLARAAKAGELEAARLRAALVANGTGVPANFKEGCALLSETAAADPIAAEQLSLAHGFSDNPPIGEQLSTEPDIILYRGAFSEAECAYLIRTAEPRLRPSFVVDPKTGKSVRNPIRNSSGMAFDPVNEDIVVRAFNLRLAALTGTAPEQGEPLHVLRYAPGEEYKLHFDALNGDSNPRFLTALVYLNRGYEGGATVFPRLDLSVSGQTGDCLVFANVGPDSRRDERSLHAGTPVAAGVKWIGSRWIRQQAIGGLQRR